MDSEILYQVQRETKPEELLVERTSFQATEIASQQFGAGRG